MFYFFLFFFCFVLFSMFRGSPVTCHFVLLLGLYTVVFPVLLYFIFFQFNINSLCIFHMKTLYNKKNLKIIYIFYFMVYLNCKFYLSGFDFAPEDIRYGFGSLYLHHKLWKGKILIRTQASNFRTSGQSSTSFNLKNYSNLFWNFLWFLLIKNVTPFVRGYVPLPSKYDVFSPA